MIKTRRYLIIAQLETLIAFLRKLRSHVEQLNATLLAWVELSDEQMPADSPDRLVLTALFEILTKLQAAVNLMNDNIRLLDNAIRGTKTNQPALLAELTRTPLAARRRTRARALERAAIQEISRLRMPARPAVLRLVRTWLNVLHAQVGLRVNVDAARTEASLALAQVYAESLVNLKVRIQANADAGLRTTPATAAEVRALRTSIRRLADDESVGELVRARLGQEFPGECDDFWNGPVNT